MLPFFILLLSSNDQSFRIPSLAFLFSYLDYILTFHLTLDLIHAEKHIVAIHL